MDNRRFEPVTGYAGRVTIPVRKTAQSAGYDLQAAETVLIGPGEVALVPTGLKVYMGPREVLIVCLRSSVGVKRGLMMANGVGVIDADYADNAQNEGHMLIPLFNTGRTAVQIEAGERIAQGIFLPFVTTADDTAEGSRTGGFGSTGN